MSLETLKATEALMEKIKTPSESRCLPAGKDVYPSDVINMKDNGEVDVHPMITEDERLFASSSTFTDGTGILNIIRKRVPKVLNPELLFTPEIVFLIAAIRALTFTSKYDVTAICDKCGKEFETLIDSNTLKVKTYEEEDLVRTVTLSNDQTIKYTYLTFLKEIEVSKLDDMHASYTTRIIEVDGITDPLAIKTWFKHLPPMIKKELVGPFEEKLGGFETNDIPVECLHCKKQTKASVNLLGGFFIRVLSLNSAG